MLIPSLSLFTLRDVLRASWDAQERDRAGEVSASLEATPRFGTRAVDLGRVVRYGRGARPGGDPVHLFVADRALIVMRDPPDTGDEVTLQRFPLESVESVECGPPSSPAATGDCSQAETHLFVHFKEGVNADGLELSLGAMDDDTPVRHLCEVLRGVIRSGGAGVDLTSGWRETSAG